MWACCLNVGEATWCSLHLINSGKTLLWSNKVSNKIRVICWSLSSLVSEIHNQCSNLLGNFRRTLKRTLTDFCVDFPQLLQTNVDFFQLGIEGKNRAKNSFVFPAFASR